MALKKGLPLWIDECCLLLTFGALAAASPVIYLLMSTVKSLKCFEPSASNVGVCSNGKRA